jgi:hypothetical protein
MASNKVQKVRDGFYGGIPAEEPPQVTAADIADVAGAVESKPETVEVASEKPTRKKPTANIVKKAPGMLFGRCFLTTRPLFKACQSATSSDLPR